MRQIMARQKKITLQMDPRNSRHCCFFFVKCTFIMALESKRPLVREKRVFSFDFPFILLERTSKRPALHVWPCRFNENANLAQPSNPFFLRMIQFLGNFRKIQHIRVPKLCRRNIELHNLKPRSYFYNLTPT